AKRSIKRSVKTKEYIALATTINELGFEVIPCSYCFSCGLCCHIIESSSCYGKYVRIIDESKRLNRLEQDTKEALYTNRDLLAKV
ncbi:hypothetical protein MYCTH_80299, partial [Thermothelomyces thermophilus ATCC 42464]